MWSYSAATGTLPGSSTSWSPTAFPDSFGTSGLFTGNQNNRATNVDGYRYASLCAEVKDVTSLYTSAGSVIVQKFPVRVTQTLVASPAMVATGAVVSPIVAKATSASPPVITFQDSATTPNSVTLATTNIIYEYPALNGLDVTGVEPSRAYVGHIRDGAFTRSIRARDDYTYRPIMEGIGALASNNQFGTLGGDFLGCDDAMEAMYFRIDVPASTSLSVRMRVWACVEYRPLNQSSLYEYSRLAPDRDMLALALYYKYAQQLPLAVIAAENDFSWRHLWDWVKSALAAASFVPGPVGMAASAVGALGEAVERLVL